MADFNPEENIELNDFDEPEPFSTDLSDFTKLPHPTN